MKNNILHIMKPEKFNIPFIDFTKKHFDISSHKFLFLSKPRYEYGMTKAYKIIWIKNNFFKLLKELYIADRIILHGLWKQKFIFLLMLNPWLLKKCYWVIWGGDLYPLENKNFIEKYVIKRMGNFVTYIKGDYELIKNSLKAKGNYHQCLMYPSNLYKKYDVLFKTNDCINIQIGNSGFETNNHRDILNQLKKYKDENIKIFAPLSYGSQEYAKEVIKYAKEVFGDKFIPLTEFMDFEDYLEFLGSIDIAIFAHKRQQAMGNTITLLGLGKKVYMRNDITPWQLFNDIGIKVFDAENIEIDLIDKQTQKDNQQKIKNYFSEENYLIQLRELFNSEIKIEHE